MRTILFGLVTLFFLGAIVDYSAAQVKEISRDEYYTPFRSAVAKSRTLSRLHVQDTTSIRNGQVQKEHWTYKYQLPDRIHYVHLLSAAGKTIRTEQISIGETRYCKKGEGAWTQTVSSCIGGGDGSGGPSNIRKEVFTREKTKLNGRSALLFTHRTTYKDVHSKDANADGLSFWDTKYWLDDDGLIRRSETRRGLVKDSTASYEMVETYEYDPTLKIEAPIK